LVGDLWRAFRRVPANGAGTRMTHDADWNGRLKRPIGRGDME